MELDSGYTGAVYGISTESVLERVQSICYKLPWGNKKWKEVTAGKFRHVTVGNTHMYAVADDGTVFKFSP